MRAKKRIQLRRCQFCNKPGHNKATCPDFLLSQKKSEIKSSLPVNKKIKILYHNPEQKNSDTVSPYIVNLKNPKNHWHSLEDSSPREEKNEWEKFYEKINKQTKEKIPLANINFVSESSFSKKDIIEEKFENKSIKEENISNFNSLVGELAKELEDLESLVDKLSKNVAKKDKEYTIQKPDKPLFSFVSSLEKINWRKSLAVTMTILIILALPLQTRTFYTNLKISTEKITQSGTGGFMALQDSTAAIMTANLPVAQNSIVHALENFNTAVEEIQSHRILQKIISGVPILKSEVQSRQNLVLAGQKIALANTYLIKGISEANNQELSPLERLNIVSTHLKSAIPNYEDAFENMNKVKVDILPLEYRSAFEDFTLLFQNLLSDLKNISDLSQNINEIFGNSSLRRYLVVFQNEAEIRATGGFMGSFAVLDIKNGKIEKIEIPAGGSYDLQGQSSVLVEPPNPLFLSNKKWEFQDANWFPDFKISAEKMLWFYRHSRNITLDGVIAVNSSVLERLLSLVGPITDEKRELVLSEKTALNSLQNIVENGSEKKENKPKQIISDLAPQFLSSIFSLEPKNTLPLLFNLNEALIQKEVQVYFTAPATQQAVERFGWGGRIIQTPDDKDYLMVVNSNIQGQKSDAQIKQSIYHQSLVEKDGTIINTVTITRIHEGILGQNFYGQTNINYLRLYVPEGSEIISAHGFTWPEEKYFRAPVKGAVKDLDLASWEKEIGIEELSGTRITKEFGKTAFGNWVITEPGTKSTVQFIYRLPFKAFTDNKNPDKKIFDTLLNSNKITSQYQIVVQRQSGSRSTFESQVIYPENFEPVWNSGENSNLALNGHFIPETPLKRDGIWSLLMEKNK